MKGAAGMDECVLLTDDEVVALSAIDGRAWPLGLITVEADPVEITRAGMRGMRSLLVRRYVDESGGLPQPDAAIARYIAGFLSADTRVGAYVAPVTDPGTLSGASVTGAHSADGWLLDTVTAAGVHALRSATADEVLEAILSLVDQAKAGVLFAGADDPTRWVCVVSVGSEQHVVGDDGSAAALVRSAVSAASTI